MNKRHAKGERPRAELDKFVETTRRGWETRRRRARGEPDPSPTRKKLASDALVWWSDSTQRISVRTSYRASLLSDIHARIPKAARWFRDFDRTWLFAPSVLVEVYAILSEHFERVALDVEVARRLGWILFPPQGPNGEERAA